MITNEHYYFRLQVFSSITTIAIKLDYIFSITIIITASLFMIIIIIIELLICLHFQMVEQKLFQYLILILYLITIAGLIIAVMPMIAKPLTIT